MIASKNHCLSVVYKELLPVLLVHGFRYTDCRVSVEDSIQDVFTNLCEKEDISDIENIKHYVRRSFVNTLLNNIIRTRQHINIEEISYNYHHENSVEDIFLESEEIQLFKSYIANLFECLSDREKEIIHLYYIEQLSYDEICKITGDTNMSARLVIHRALSRIKKNLQKRRSCRNI